MPPWEEGVVEGWCGGWECGLGGEGREGGGVMVGWVMGGCGDGGGGKR